MKDEHHHGPNEPLHNRVLEMVLLNAILTSFVTFFAILRLVVVYRSKKRWMLADYFLMAAIIVNASSSAGHFVMTANGHGRHIYDPFITPKRLRTYNKSLFASQLLGVYAMGCVKASICATLMALNFSRIYRAVVWFSVAIVVCFNFISPTVSRFGYCRPISMAWDPKQPGGKCWDPQVRVMLSYINVSSNIVTDIIYTAAPLVYIAQTRLPKKMKIGVCTVFLFALCCSVISVLRLHESHYLGKRHGDIIWDSTDLSIYSQAEVNIGMFCASLPPLRKLFEKYLSYVLPSSIIEGSNTNKRDRGSDKGSGFVLHTIGSKRPHFEMLGDDGSERGILKDDVHEIVKNGGIYRSTHVRQTVAQQGSNGEKEVTRF